jgi:hypothetical protein
MPWQVPHLGDVGIVGWQLVQDGPLCGTPPRLVPWQYVVAQPPVPFVKA